MRQHVTALNIVSINLYREVTRAGSLVCSVVQLSEWKWHEPRPVWYFFVFFPLSWSEVTLAGWAPGRDPSGRQTAGRGTRSCCPSQPTGRLTGPKACQTDTTPGRAGGREGVGEGATEGVYGGGGWHRGQSVSNAFIYFIYWGGGVEDTERKDSQWCATVGVWMGLFQVTEWAKSQ